jgi:hypothetical protein
MIHCKKTTAAAATYARIQVPEKYFKLLRGVGKNLFIVISSLCYKSKGKNFTDVI